MDQLIDKVLQWGTDKGITGPDGKGTCYRQSDKMMEEAKETYHAVTVHDFDEIKDGIGDTTVTLILLASMYGWTLEECLQQAYNVISKRTGEMVNGVFVKSTVQDDDFDEPLGQACVLGDTECESCQ